jgi:3-hydroxyisobutyrate dehydrogenase
MAEHIGSRPSVALLGTGIMGEAMGRAMLRAGLPLRAWNRTHEKAKALESDGASVAATPAEAVKDAQVIVTMLANTDAVADTMAAAGPGLQAGQVWLQTSTVGVAGLSRLEVLASAHDLIFVDSPVVGTRAPAEKGALIVLAAGPDEARAAAQPVFDAIGSKTLWVGQTGAASRLKLVTNSWVLALTTAVAEALALARGLDIDPRLFLETVSGGPLDCAYLQTKAAAILNNDFSPSFTVELAGKDASLVAGASADAGIRLDVAPAVAARFRRTADLGHATEDMAATYFASFDAR